MSSCLLLIGLTVRSVVPVGLTWTTTFDTSSWTPISLYTGRICVTLHLGLQSCQLGSVLTERVNLRGPPISCLFITARANLSPDKSRSHISKLSACEQSGITHWWMLNLRRLLKRKHKVLAMMLYLESTISLLAQRVLADGNDLFVLQKFFSFGAEVS